MTGVLITVTVVRGGRAIKKIERPLHVVDGRKAVVFRKKLTRAQLLLFIYG